MGYRFPEQPILFYPSLACRIGSDEALLLALYHDHARYAGRGEAAELLLSRGQWLQLAPFWDESKLRAVTDSLVRQGCLDASCDSQLVRLSLQPDTPEPPPAAAVTRDAPPEPVSRLPVRETPPRPLTRQALRPQPAERMIEARGPAPTFGGASGWRRHKDELQVLFEQHEERNQQLKPMQMGWRPSETFFALLPRQSIPPEFAEAQLDEFVLYWLDKDRRESNWDQKFLAWVKREWVRKETREGRGRDAQNTRPEQQRQSGHGHEDTRRDTREKRKQVTAAIMDIRDTDW